MLGRILRGLATCVSGFVTYKLFEYWWIIYNKVYGVITPLQKTLADFAFCGGIIFAVMTFFGILWTLSD